MDKVGFVLSTSLIFINFMTNLLKSSILLLCKSNISSYNVHSSETSPPCALDFSQTDQDEEAFPDIKVFYSDEKWKKLTFITKRHLQQAKNEYEEALIKGEILCQLTFFSS